MFTGLVEGTGQVKSLDPNKGSVRLTVDAGPLTHGTRIGDSVAVNGCCLTVTTINGNNIAFDLLEETLSRTNLGAAKPGAVVNLERAMPADGRYGGHFVTGHIDATGIVRSWTKRGTDDELLIGIEKKDGIYLVPKGCIAVDGISLTVGEVGPDSFSVWIIPHTREVTALSQRKEGDRINLEFDLLAKYAEKILSAR